MTKQISMKKTIFVCLLAIAILLSSVVFYISDNQMMVYASYSTDAQNENIVVTSLDAASFDLMCNELDQDNFSLYERNVEILRELNLSEEIIQSMSEEEINLMLANAESIESKMTYYSTDENGNSVIISEDECIEMIENHKNNSMVAAADNGGSNNKMVGNGCMRITTTTIFLDPSSENNQKGWFFIHVWYEWLVLDEDRRLDIISISVPDVSWDDDLTNSFSSSYYYHVTDSEGNVGHCPGPRVTGEAMSFGGINGFGYSWDLPKDSGSAVVSYLQFYLKAKARLDDHDREDTHNVFAYYEHLRYCWRPVPRGHENP